MALAKKWQEHSDTIRELQASSPHFNDIFAEHSDLDQQIRRLSSDVVTNASRDDEIEQMKRRKLQLKDEIYRQIDKAKLQVSA
ncbi:YdcH family protein [Psychrobacter ciconiae]|uniref:YdcH family protein n=1 Tax=Psychrobacter ciconiae TaxID=1553449 RepID=UPI00191B2894|nr:DUF465 domain-containing protein [Psychrobacter ciconiae]